jgi:hypothetical protein
MVYRRAVCGYRNDYCATPYPTVAVNPGLGKYHSRYQFILNIKLSHYEKDYFVIHPHLYSVLYRL